MMGAVILARALDKIKSLQDELDKYKELFIKTEAKLIDIYASNGWNLLVQYYKCRNWLLPADSIRDALTRGLLSPLLRLVKWFGKLRPRRKRSVRARNSFSVRFCVKKSARSRRSRSSITFRLWRSRRIAVSPATAFSS